MYFIIYLSWVQHFMYMAAACSFRDCWQAKSEIISGMKLKEIFSHLIRQITENRVPPECPSSIPLFDEVQVQSIVSYLMCSTTDKRMRD